MPTWKLHAILAMVFAGCTSVIAKKGLAGITGELALTLRTLIVFLLIGTYALIALPAKAYTTLRPENYLWLGLSALTTAASWLYYYKALEKGDVTTIALIDKGSILIAILLATLFLGETITPRLATGALLILSGILLIAKK